MKTAFAVVALFAGASAFNGKGASGWRVTGVEIRVCALVRRKRLKMMICGDIGERIGTGEP